MTFLSDVADHLLSHHREQLGEITVVFPNRRAGLFLKKHLSKKVESPVWAPTIFSLEDFLFQFSEIKKADTLTLVFELYEAFKQHQPQAEGFEAFYFWGEMLLRDFEEVDHYLIAHKQLFHYVKSDRQLAEDFYFLDERQERLIREFWQQFFSSASNAQKAFVETWKILSPVYESFKERLAAKGIGYTSHIYRDILSRLHDNPLDVHSSIIFAGFNALTPAEESLLKYFVSEHQSEVLWDIDAHYMNDEEQEAGDFLRRYQKDTLLGRTFPKDIPGRITLPKEVEVTGVSLEIGQAKAVGEQIADLISKGVSPEEIVVVLPQDHMLFPMLNAIPEQVDKLNVTMGYPLKDTPLFGLLEAALEVQEQLNLSPENGLSFYHKPTLDVLSHPYLYRKEKASLDQLIKDIRKKNQIMVFQSDIQKVGSPVLNIIFRQVNENEDFASYLKKIVAALAEEVEERFGLEREYSYHFHMMLSRLSELFERQTERIDLKTFKSLFRKAARSMKIPFSGEPVEGLQIMGVLETRNLDFKHVFFLNMNEDIFPSSQRPGSFIPYGIRKAYSLPTFEVQDAIYAYLFYRLFHRAEHLAFYYNMYADFGMSGEVSRFIRQVELETNLTVKRKKLSNSIQVKETHPITISKTKEVLDQLLIYTNDEAPKGRKKLSASALNVYFTCKLQFYFKYVLRLFSQDEISDELDKRNFGTVLHLTLEFLYKDAVVGKLEKMITGNDFFKIRNSVDGAIEKAFRLHYGVSDKKKFELKDRNVIMADLIRKFIYRIIEMDEAYAPFAIIDLEGRYDRAFIVKANNKNYEVNLTAEIDRVDRKDTTVRVIDYKSGKDAKEIESIEKLFDSTPKSKRNKAGFQTFFYAWLYVSNTKANEAVVPGLFNMLELFRPDFDYRLTVNGTPITDARPYLHEFEDRLGGLLGEIFDASIPFDQTEDESMCKFCDYKGICGR